uniref:Uncharacterized protein n=1 Tax=Heterorhabditis bacteriophora TaxID=37862 RepID=A0A1I7X650_HETBA
MEQKISIKVKQSKELNSFDWAADPLRNKYITAVDDWRIRTYETTLSKNHYTIIALYKIYLKSRLNT